MSRQASIPTELHNTLVTRWLAGSSPTALLAWIQETNATRKVPVVTSRTSIQRLMTQIGQRDATACQLQAVHRARLNTTAHMDAVDDIMTAYDQCASSAMSIQSAIDATRIRVRLQALHREEIGRNRQLRIAGVGGRAGERLVEKHAELSRQWGLELAAQDAREDAGIPPEQGSLPLPALLLEAAVAAPAVAEAPPAAAPPRVEVPETPKVPESKPLVPQPIVDVNRAAQTPGAAERTPRPPVAAAQVPPLSRRVRPTFPVTDVPADLIAAALRSPPHMGQATG